MSIEKHEIDQDIASLNRTLSQTPDDHPASPLLLVCLGNSHMKRLAVSHDLRDLDKSIEFVSIALTLTPDDDPGMSGLLSARAAAHGERFIRLGEIDDINKAIESAHNSINLTPEGNPRLPIDLLNLGTFYGSRFGHLGNLADLEYSIEYHSYALAIAPEDHPSLPAFLDGLGASQTERFERMGKLDDIDDAIAYMSRGVSLATPGHPDLPRGLTNLGGAHGARFQRLGELSDLEKTIEYVSRALALVPDDHPGLPYMFLSLGTSHYDRYMRQGRLDDLENAIEYQSRSVALTPDGHPHLPSRLAHLGGCYARRFERLDELNDLESGIECQTRAIALTPSGHPELPKMYANLAVAHMDRFERQGKPHDLKTVVKYEGRALSLVPEDHPYTADWLHNHARTQLQCYQHTRNISHIRLSLYFFRRASKALHAAPHKKFNTAQTWAKAASLFSPDGCIEAYQTAIDLLPQVIWLGSTTNKRYEDISTTGALAVNAASAAIRLSKYTLALEWLEHTRCVVWNQHLMLRSPVDQLMLVNADLATRLQAVATQLHSAGSESREARAVNSGVLTVEQVVQEHHQLAKDYDGLLVQIRQLDGFEDFLRPMKIHGLLHATRAGPVVMINTHEDGCDALIIRPGDNEVHHVALPSFTAQKAQEARKGMDSSLRAKGVRERGFTTRQKDGQVASMAGVLAKLWHEVVKPILEFLGCMTSNSNRDLPHLTWCPTGALSFLPLHAAGDYDQPRSRVFDYVISSYTPTFTALLKSTPSSLSGSCRVLAIGQAATPGHSPLPGTEAEIACIRAHTEGNVQYSEILNHQATVPAVLDAMEQHDWVHLACHAHQNVTDPTKSGFFLHNGTLDLAAINRRSFRGKGLAFLSACQTATGDEKLADEAVHLASGMLMAGYTSVIGTMWSVHDDDAPLIADKVYAQLMKDRKLGNGEAGRALHHAVACLRETVGEQRFERWVPYIHIGS